MRSPVRNEGWGAARFAGKKNARNYENAVFLRTLGKLVSVDNLCCNAIRFRSNIDKHLDFKYFNL